MHTAPLAFGKNKTFQRLALDTGDYDPTVCVSGHDGSMKKNIANIQSSRVSWAGVYHYRVHWHLLQLNPASPWQKGKDEAVRARNEFRGF